MISPATIKGLFDVHREQRATVTLATAMTPDFLGWRSTFASFGRIVRDAKGTIVRIVESSDAIDGEKDIREIKPAYMCIAHNGFGFA